MKLETFFFFFLDPTIAMCALTLSLTLSTNRGRSRVILEKYGNIAAEEDVESSAAANSSIFFNARWRLSASGIITSRKQKALKAGLAELFRKRLCQAGFESFITSISGANYREISLVIRSFGHSNVWSIDHIEIRQRDKLMIFLFCYLILYALDPSQVWPFFTLWKIWELGCFIIFLLHLLYDWSSFFQSWKNILWFEGLVLQSFGRLVIGSFDKLTIWMMQLCDFLLVWRCDFSTNLEI